jgi:hypothetical protein
MGKAEIIFFSAFVLAIGLFLFFAFPDLHWWKSDYQKNSDWCKLNKPMMNLSLDSEHIAFCYGEGWKDYCKISYPDYCPEGIKPFDEDSQIISNTEVKE